MHTGKEVATAPQVSIILPVFNDEDHIEGALKSCMAQTQSDIEIIVVDDASTDATVSIVERLARSDKRVRLLRQSDNRTAFQARRLGIEHSTAPYVLFLDGDDELLPEAAETALAVAHGNTADVVAFGCQVVKPDGSVGGSFEAGMQPKHEMLVGDEIVRALFPIGGVAQGQLWRYMFARDLLVAAYSSLPANLVLPRANDLPIAFLSLMRAQKYVSTPAVLYRYFFRRGASGHRAESVADFLFASAAIDSVDSIASPVAAEALSRGDDDDLEAIFRSVRSSIIGRVLEVVREIVDEALRSDCLALLVERVGLSVLASACVDYCPKALRLIAPLAIVPELAQKEPKHIVLRASNLGTGGAQGVVIAQASYLTAAGFEVTIAIDAVPDTHFRLPDGVQVTQVTGRTLGQKVANFSAFCVSQGVDVVIDHYVLYHERWPYYALALAEIDVPMIGWVHNFAMRPILDGSNRAGFLKRFLPLLAMTVVLSEADVAYWKLLGVERVAYLPNPASPTLAELGVRSHPRNAPEETLEIIWWGRLQQSTKRVRELIEIGSMLGDLHVDFRITVIGPDGNDLKAAELHELAQQRGIGGNLITPGQLHHDELIAAIEHSHVYVSTSVIEGYPLALVEAQALGLPLVMYELPWLATLDGNSGVVSVEQGDRRGAARALATLVKDPARFTELSEGSLSAARAALSHDFGRMYSDLVRGSLGAEHSPEPTVDIARLLIDQNLAFAETLIAKERRAVDKARANAVRHEKRARNFEKALARKSPEVRKAPSVLRKGLRGWLMNFIPTSMRQSSYYARHEFNAADARHRELVRSQVALNERLTRIEAAISAVRRDTKNVAPALQPLIQADLSRIEAAVIGRHSSSGSDDEVVNGRIWPAPSTSSHAEVSTAGLER